MMLSTLQSICLAEQLVWLWGEKGAFDKLVLSTDQDVEPTILYHEGYISGTADVDQQGAFDTDYNVRLCLLIGSQLADTPVIRTPRFEQLEPLMYRVLTRIQKTYRIIGKVNIQEGINQTSTNLDGLRFTFIARRKEPIGVCIK